MFDALSVLHTTNAPIHVKKNAFKVGWDYIHFSIDDAMTIKRKNVFT